jgi:hypothetical protein
MIMWMLTSVVVFAAGYAASIYSWPAIKVWINGMTAEVERVRQRLTQLEAKLREF